MTLQDYHRTEVVDLIYKRNFLLGNTFASAQDKDIKAASTSWETPTSGKCRIFQIGNGRFGMTSSYIQEGDILCHSDKIENLFLVVRLSDEPETDHHEFNLIGRAMDIDFAPSSIPWDLKSRYRQAPTRTEARGLLIFI
jgi:hypothetical protein